MKEETTTGAPQSISGIVVRAWIRYAGKTHWEEYTYQEQPLLDANEDYLRIAVMRHVYDFNHTDEGLRYPKQLLDLEIVERRLHPLYCEHTYLFAHDWQLVHGTQDRFTCKVCGCQSWRRNIRSAFVISEKEKLAHPFGCIPHLRPI